MGDGTPIGSGRYRLMSPLPSTLPRVLRHHGQDTILDRPVTVLSLTDITAHRQEVLEAATRAVLVEDPRMQRVYDVEQGTPAFIVTEPTAGLPLTVLAASGLSPAQARAVIGEVAQVLDACSRRDLYHLNLSPDSVRIRPDGSVQVCGVGIEAAVLGLRSDRHDPLAADRTDARSLVELLYFCLTGRWPGKRSGIPSAVMTGSTPAAPSTLASGMSEADADLDALVAQTWGPQPPVSAAEVAALLGSWDVSVLPRQDAPAQQATAPAAPSITASAAEAASGLARAAQGLLGRLGTLVGGSGSGRPAGADEENEAPAPPAATSSQQAPAASETAAVGGEARAERSLPEDSGAAPVPQRPSTSPSSARPGTTPSPQQSGATPSSEGTSTVLASGQRTVAPSPEESTAATSGWTASTHGSTGNSVFGQARPASTPTSPVSREGEPATTQRESSRAVSRTTAVVLVVALVAVLVAAFLAISNLLSLVSLKVSDEDVPAAETVPTAAPAAEDSPEAEPEQPVEANAPVSISGAQSLDPYGDNNEHPELAPALVDGDPSTTWYSRYYASSSLAWKQGIGVSVALAQEAEVSAIDMQGTGSGGHVQIRATSPEDPQGGTLLAEGAFTEGTTTFDLPATTTSSLVVWVTDLPRASDGLLKVTIGEITIR